MSKKYESATNLTKRLKAIAKEIDDIYYDNRNNSVSPADWIYDSDYNYEENINKLEELYSEERKIKQLLSEFNLKTKIDGYNMTIAEGLVRLAQLQKIKNSLTELANRTSYYVEYRAGVNTTWECNYAPVQVREDLRKYQSLAARLQVAIDKTNINSKIEV